MKLQSFRSTGFEFTLAFAGGEIVESTGPHTATIPGRSGTWNP